MLDMERVFLEQKDNTKGHYIWGFGGHQALGIASNPSVDKPLVRLANSLALHSARTRALCIDASRMNAAFSVFCARAAHGARSRFGRDARRDHARGRTLSGKY